MHKENDLGALMQLIAEKSLHLISEIKNQPGQITALITQYVSLVEQFQQIIAVVITNPEAVWQAQIQYCQELTELAQIQFTHWMQGKPMPIEDPRFMQQEWLDNAFANLLSHQYILACQHMNDLFSRIVFKDPNTAKRLRFFIRNYLDALSPSNFLQTNPQLLAETIKSNGRNLLHGLYNFLSDIEVDSQRLVISMTDKDAFTLGLNIATTPGKVIFRNTMMELIQYTPKTATVNAVPLLIIPPWINKYYILDLSQKNSLVHWLVSQGITVCIISWVNPDAALASKGFFDYIEEGPRAAISVMKSQFSVKKINTLGFCIGGTLLATTLAYNKAIADTSIKSATFLATMIDFSEPGDLGVYIDEQQIALLEQQMDTKGYLSGKVMASSFNSLKANELIWSFFIKNYLYGKKSIPFDMLYWNSDTTNMPASMHSQYLRWMYLHNDLIKPGKIRLNKAPIDIHNIKIPTFFLATIKDHIAPWKSMYMGFQLMKGPKEFVLGGSGHVAGVINSPCQNKYDYKINSSAYKDPDEWLAKSESFSGSWWPYWLKWLKKQSGKAAPAPEMSNLPYVALMDAPGSYVMKKSD